MVAPAKVTTSTLLVEMVIVGVVTSMLHLWIAQRWDWQEGWLYAISSFLCFLVSRILAVRQHPDILQERNNWMKHKNVKPYDKILAPLMALGFLLVPIVAGIDHRWYSTRYNFFSFLIKVAAFAAILAGQAIISYALIENRFFSSVMRIQSDRGHTVVTTGPYAVVRHPGYSGLVLVLLGAPAWLDSPLAYGASFFLLFVTLLRTNLEDTVLKEELPGYRDYARQVPYRLIPGLW